MVKRGRGAIINVSSIAAFQPVPYMGVYGATKAFILSFTEAIAHELRGTGVSLQALCPGPTATEFLEVSKTHSGLLVSRMPMLNPEDVVRASLAGPRPGPAARHPRLREPGPGSHSCASLPAL